MANVAQNDIVAKVTELWTASERLWEAACEDDRDFTEQADKCGNAYSDAIEALEAGDTNKAVSALERAKSYEIEGGDDQHATEALALVSAEVAS